MEAAPQKGPRSASRCPEAASFPAGRCAAPRSTWPSSWGTARSPPPATSRHPALTPRCPRRRRSAVVARVNGELRDLKRPLESDAELELLDFTAPEGRAVSLAVPCAPRVPTSPFARCDPPLPSPWHPQCPSVLLVSLNP